MNKPPASDSTSEPGELAPCPFCGERLASVIRGVLNNPDYWVVCCHGCRSQGPVAAGSAEAARLWNRRVSWERF